MNLLLGHGWRQIEVRRVTARDVLDISNDLIEFQGKERRELAPILPRTAELLKQLAAGLKPSDHLFVARRVRQGQREPLAKTGCGT